MAPQSNYQAMNSLIRATAGQENIIGIPRLYIEYMDSLEGGVFLSQLIYWSDKGGRDDGWFYKTYQEWHNDIHLSEYEVRKWAKVMVAAGYLETKVMKANGDPTVHYRFNMDKFRESLIEFLSNQETEKVKEPKRKKKVSITETTSETTRKNDLRANDARAEHPQAMLFDDSATVVAQKPKPPEKQPTPKAPPDTQRMTEYIVLEWGVDSYARAGNIVKLLQGRLPKGHVHHAYNLSPPVTFEELEEFTTSHYPQACKGCSFPRSPEKIQDHFCSMRRERTNSDIPPGYIRTGTGLQEVCW